MAAPVGVKWLKTPNGDQYELNYPPEAGRSGVMGQTLLHCIVAADGYMQDCKVLSEAPKGKGFAEAALKMSRYWQMPANYRDGTPTVRTVFDTVIVWKMSDSHPRDLVSAVTNPPWTSIPSTTDIQNAAPDIGKAGTTLKLRCYITDGGGLAGCSGVDSDHLSLALRSLLEKFVVSPAWRAQYDTLMQVELSLQLPQTIPAPTPATKP